MATIYNAPSEIKLPSFNSDTYEADNADYLAKLLSYVKRLNPRGKNGGEIIKFPVADGHAEYMIVKMKPLSMVHIPLGDAYGFQYAHLMTAKEVNAQIKAEKSFQAFLDSRK